MSYDTAALWLKTAWAVCTTTGFLTKITRIGVEVNQTIAV